MSFVRSFGNFHKRKRSPRITIPSPLRSPLWTYEKFYEKDYRISLIFTHLSKFCHNYLINCVQTLNRILVRMHTWKCMIQRDCSEWSCDCDTEPTIINIIYGLQCIQCKYVDFIYSYIAFTGYSPYVMRIYSVTDIFINL